MVTSVEKALRRAAEVFDFRKYQISQEDILKIRQDEDYNEKIRQANLKVKPKILGNYFDENLQESIISYFSEIGPKGYDATVRSSMNRVYLTYALEDWFYKHYGEEFLEFGKFIPDIDRIPDNNAYDGLKLIFAQADDHPRAFFGFSLFVAGFPDFDTGLKVAFEKGYRYIVAELKNKGFSTYKRLPPWIPEGFRLFVEETKKEVEGRPQKRNIIKKIVRIHDVIKDRYSTAPQNVKENILKTLSLVNEPKRIYPLNPEEHFFALDSLEETIDWLEREEFLAAESSDVEIIIRKL